MKMNLRSLMTLLVVTVSITLLASCDKDSFIDTTQLPAEAQTFIDTYFASAKVVTVMKEGTGPRAEYDVNLADGTSLSFNHKGEWTDVDCGLTAVPAGIVPEQIVLKINELYPLNFITNIDREHDGYGIELDNGVDLSFNKKFILKEVD